MLKEFLKQNKKIIEAHVDKGSEPLFDCPPLIYSPIADPYANLIPPLPEERFPFLREMLKYVITQNISRSSIKDFVTACTAEKKKNEIM
jgi:hypothetical protein